MKNTKRKVNYTLLMALGFLMLIFIGAIILSLPFSSRQKISTDFIDCIFTATSAVCVTGLTPFDVWTHWSLTGQITIILLIQIGGLGFMTLISFFASFFKKNFSVSEKNLVMQSTGSPELGGLIPLLRKIFLLTFVFEFFGAIILSFKFYPITKNFFRAVFFGFFHSVSAFCNAGFDLCGIVSPSTSLSIFQSDVAVNATICILIVSGGLGFVVWENIIKYKLKFSKYDIHSKLVICTTAILIVFGTIIFFFSETNASMANQSTFNRSLQAIFQSITLRTAGFSTIEQSKLSVGGYVLSVIYMAIGGSPGSTAGGIKTTTFAVFVLGMISALRQKKDILIFKRRLDSDLIRQASAIIGLFFAFTISSSIIICTIDGFTLRDVLFETVSAAGTVGLTTSITGSLSVISKIIVCILMYGGRVGGFSLIIMLAKTSFRQTAKRPVGKIMIG